MFPSYWNRGTRHKENDLDIAGEPCYNGRKSDKYLYKEHSIMKLTWLGHSCFTVESQGYRIVLDPYQDGSVPGLAPIRVRISAPGGSLPVYGGDY